MSEIRIKTLVVGMVGTNCYLVYDHETKRAAVIDPGDGAGQIANMAVSLGLKPEAILLTHGHFDHIMAAKELKETWNVPIYACEKEIDVLTDGQKSLVAGYFREPYTITPDVTVKEGDELSIAGFTWKVFETPGHTIGSCCYYICSLLRRYPVCRLLRPHRFPDGKRTPDRRICKTSALHTAGRHHGLSGAYGHDYHRF